MRCIPSFFSIVSIALLASIAAADDRLYTLPPEHKTTKGEKSLFEMVYADVQTRKTKWQGYADPVVDEETTGGSISGEVECKEISESDGTWTIALKLKKCTTLQK